MSNEAVFEIYMDTSESTVEAYFGKGIYDPEKHQIICKLPTNCEGFKPNYVVVDSDISNIDCKQTYSEKMHIKYSSYELNKRNLRLLIVKKLSFSLIIFNESTFASSVVASTELGYVYKKGRINRIHISKNGVLDYCDIKK